MTARCSDLDPFFDQELPRDATREFREHLGCCDRCQRLLRGRMIEAAMVSDAQLERRPRTAGDAVGAVSVPSLSPPPPSEPAVVPRAHAIVREVRARRRLLAGGAAVAVAGSLALALAPMRAGPPATPVALALAERRSVEVRFSAPALDHHRPFGVMRAAGPASHERITLTELAELERRGDRHTLIGAFALNGDLVSAERSVTALAQAERHPSARTLTDRAAIELLRGPGAGDDAAASAERALSLASQALRTDPRSAQAQWNRALALRRLGLSLLAARAFDEIAGLREPGWLVEATANADQLRRSYQRRADDWRHTKAEADRMVLGGPVLADTTVAMAPSLARDAFYLALATASTPARIDQLAGLARALDARFATTALGDLVARVRASDLRRRAPLAAELEAIILQRKPSEAVDGLRAQALDHDARDIVLASVLVIDATETTDADLVVLDQVLAGNRDPWWDLIRLARRLYVLEFQHRDHAAVDAAARLAAPICQTIHSTWCGRIARLAASANSEMGRADLAIEQLASARRQAQQAAVPQDEIAALEALGRATAIRVTDDLDSQTVADAYLEEAALRDGSCEARLSRLDFAAGAALRHHRFAAAAKARHDADVLEQERCQDSALRLGGETARVRLMLHGEGSAETLRDHLARLQRHGASNQGVYLEVLRAAATLAEDRPAGEAGLRHVIATTTADPSLPYAADSRAIAFDALIESVAVARDASAVLELLAERVGAPRFTRCVVGAASWNRLVVAALDAGGLPSIEIREIGEGELAIPPPEVVSPALRARLAGCARVEVIAPGSYFGSARLLGDDVAWVYRSGAGHAAPPVGTPRELVVSGATPPEDLHLPALQAFDGGSDAEVLSGAAATPENVLRAMTTATLAVIFAHALTDASEPSAASLLLSPDAQADYLLTASRVRSARLTQSPAVIIAGCDAGRVQISPEPWSLATSFLAAGARVVVAPIAPIPDTSASAVFRSLVERIRRGADPADALVTERRLRPGLAWLSSIVVFE